MKNRKNKLVYIGFGFLHHLNGHAGYHQIKNYIDYDIIIDAQKYHNICANQKMNRVEAWLRAKFLPLFCFGFTAFPWYLIKCIFLALIKGHLTFHFIYGENLFYDFRLLHIRGCKVVLTLHQPYEWFVSRESWRKRLQKVDHIILVGNAEVSKFKLLTGKDNVTFIPHGICDDFYTDNGAVKKEKMVLTVGNWLRDFNTADKVYQALLEEYSDLQIIIVSNPINKKYITANDRIEFLSGITDDVLLDLYRKTSCLFLPLKRYTANNALLEAGSVGCPILIASNEPDNSYIPEKYISLVPLHVDKITSAINMILASDKGNDDLALFVKNHYGWKGIGLEIKELLKSLE